MMQFGWTLPDAALIGLAQLNAEGDRARTNDVVKSLIRLHLLIAGGIACTLLVLNAGFVQSWVGRDLFGGLQLNAIFALDIVVLSAAHALLTPTAVLGQRVGVGILSAANGVAHIGFALLLGHFWGLRGVAAATTVSALVTSIPVAGRMLSSTTGMGVWRLFNEQFFPWFARLLPWAVVGAIVGRVLTTRSDLGRHGPLACGVGITAILGLAYLFTMKGMLRGLPFGARITRILSAIRLV